MIASLTLREMLEMLDGQGLVITEPDELEAALSGTGFGMDSEVRPVHQPEGWTSV